MRKLSIVLAIAIVTMACIGISIGIVAAVPEMGQTEKDLACSLLKDYYPEVRDAAVTQKSTNELAVLTAIVNYGTNEARAIEIGTKFVTMLKTYCNDGFPMDGIGKGKYNYKVSIFEPDLKPIVMGEKSPEAEEITWDYRRSEHGR